MNLVKKKKTNNKKRLSFSSLTFRPFVPKWQAGLLQNRKLHLSHLQHIWASTKFWPHRIKNNNIKYKNTSELFPYLLYWTFRALHSLCLELQHSSVGQCPGQAKTRTLHPPLSLWGLIGKTSPGGPCWTWLVQSWTQPFCLYPLRNKKAEQLFPETGRSSWRHVREVGWGVEDMRRGGVWALRSKTRPGCGLGSSSRFPVVPRDKVIRRLQGAEVEVSQGDFTDQKENQKRIVSVNQ